ncbi:MAG TPA: hypothetical protein DCE71_02460 [Parachlamydiales bacterium]|nr:hypothetical protein [Parachlamydiales bacterium]
MTREELTTEWIRKKFKSNFDLCSFGIAIGRNLVVGGGWHGTLGDVLDVIDRRADQDRKPNELKDVSLD